MPRSAAAKTEELRGRARPHARGPPASSRSIRRCFVWREIQETARLLSLLGATPLIHLDGHILHGRDPDSCSLAKSEGYAIEERSFDERNMEMDAMGEAASSGTARHAGRWMIHERSDIASATAKVGELTRALRAKLVSIQRGELADQFGWTRLGVG